MFQSVIEQGGWLRTGRLGTGAGVSVLVHAGLIGAVLLLSGRAVQETPDPIKDIPNLRLTVPAPPRGNPTPPVANQVTPQRKPRKQLVPRQVPPPPVATPEPVKDEPPPAAPDAPPAVAGLPYIPGSDPNGVDEGGTPHVPLPEGLRVAIGGTGEEDVIPFGPGMRPPELLSSPTIELPREALLAQVEGMLIAKCVITQQGEVEDCRVIKGLPHMDDTVVSALEERRYRPVVYQGRAVSVSYVFNIRIKQPR
jgi:protein TonB